MDKKMRGKKKFFWLQVLCLNIEEKPFVTQRMTARSVGKQGYQAVDSEFIAFFGERYIGILLWPAGLGRMSSYYMW